MDRSLEGWLNGLAGVLIFSGSLPATRAAVIGFDPVFLTLARASIAGAIGLALLVLSRQRLPGRGDLAPLAVVAAGVVIGFPLLTALALRHMAASPSIVFTGLLPLATAAFAVLRGGERPDRRFWLFAGLGSLCVAGFAWSPASLSDPTGDLLMLAAILVCGLGYAEGAVLARRLGGWQVICWALVLCAPFLLLPVGWLAWAQLFGSHAAHPEPLALKTWLAFGYVTLFSQFIGFFAWYAGLAMGGIARVGQVQLLQIFFTIAFSALLFGETVTPSTWLFAAAVIATVMLGRRSAVATAPRAARAG